MKTSKWRSLLRAFYAFLIAFATLWAMPRNAHAQLYVTQAVSPGIVSEYNASTGKVIKSNFITALNGDSKTAIGFSCAT
jgi:hypothetical protein